MMPLNLDIHQHTRVQMNNAGYACAAMGWALHDNPDEIDRELAHLDADGLRSVGIAAVLLAARAAAVSDAMTEFGPDSPVGGFAVGAGAERAL